jgi:hypothetical protein
MNNVYVMPPQLLTWLTPEEKSRSLVLLELDLDSEAVAVSTYSVRLNIVFNKIPLRRGHVLGADFNVGVCAADVEFEATDGSIRGFTPGTKVEVTRRNTTIERRKTDLSLMPVLSSSVSVPRMEAKLEPGSVSMAAGVNREYVSEFKCRGPLLSTIHMGNVLKWLVALPRGDDPARDFLIGNLWLNVECSWRQHMIPKGRVLVRPSDVRFFDGAGRAAGKLQSIAMYYALWRKGLLVDHLKGVEVRFEVRA